MLRVSCDMIPNNIAPAIYSIVEQVREMFGKASAVLLLPTDNRENITRTFPGVFCLLSRRIPDTIRTLSRTIPQGIPKPGGRFPEQTWCFPEHFPNNSRTKPVISFFFLLERIPKNRTLFLLCPAGKGKKKRRPQNGNLLPN